MYAVVDIAGQQFKVTENTKYYVPKLNEKVDAKITFGNVLLIGDDNKTDIGFPFLKGAKVSAKVLEHIKDEKVIVYKKKRRTNYEKSNGHRQQLTRIEVTKIALTSKESETTNETEEVADVNEKTIKETKAPKEVQKTKSAKPSKTTKPVKAEKVVKKTKAKNESKEKE
ncbi:MAG: 50S ribosomal protein L21 [Ignavibacteriales bacterium CG_4_9_14_3_um_filter_30_11]|nr:MAG: 50S ribosomal protein L21 [Ignavibacteriales bacterium CG_4_9_14_3_um_filter_30_11]